MREPAAVLLGLKGENLLFTKRAASLRSFTGHVCFPGGKSEPNDENLTETATREFLEEIYFSGQIRTLMCMFPEYSLITNQGIYPIIASLHGEITGHNPDEVERSFFIPLSELTVDKFTIHPEYPTIKHNKCFSYDGELVWGLTAHILYKFVINYKKYFTEIENG